MNSYAVVVIAPLIRFKFYAASHRQTRNQSQLQHTMLLGYRHKYTTNVLYTSSRLAAFVTASVMQLANWLQNGNAAVKGKGSIIGQV